MAKYKEKRWSVISEPQPQGSFKAQSQAGCLAISIRACDSLLRKLDITTKGQDCLKFLLGNASMNPEALAKDRPAVLREGILLCHTSYF